MGTNFVNLIVECAEDCGNAPKKNVLKELNVAFAKHEIEFILDWVTDDVVWEIVGDQLIHGKDDVEKVLLEMKDYEVQRLSIHNIITHGNTASLNGTLLLSDQQKIDFCDVYNFRGFGKKAKIKSITSYVIKTT